MHGRPIFFLNMNVHDAAKRVPEMVPPRVTKRGESFPVSVSASMEHKPAHVKADRWGFTGLCCQRQHWRVGWDSLRRFLVAPVSAKWASKGRRTSAITPPVLVGGRMPLWVCSKPSLTMYGTNPSCCVLSRVWQPQPAPGPDFQKNGQKTLDPSTFSLEYLLLRAPTPHPP